MSSITTEEVFKKASSEDLNPLVEYILKASMTETLSINALYERHSPDHTKYHQDILDEIRSFGGNSYANLWRGCGPGYFEVVCDVAKKFKINKPESYTLADLENKIIIVILKDAFDKTEGKERAEIEAALKEAGLSKKDFSSLLSGASLASILGANLARVASYRASIQVANAVSKQMLGHGLRVGSNAALTRGLAAFTGPVGWVITGLWTAFDIAGPAYRVTVPCVIHIAMLRQKFVLEAETQNGNPFDDE